MEQKTHSLMDTARVLAEEIGPRPSAGEAEGRAAEYVAGRLRSAGFEVRIEPFRGPRSFTPTYALIYGAFVAAAPAALLRPEAGFTLALLGLAAMLLENSGREAVSRLLPKAPSRNVVGIRPPTGVVCRRVVLTCHLDSARAALLWHPKLVAGFRRSFLMMVGAMLAVAGLTGWAALSPSMPAPAWALLWAGAAYLLGSVLLIAHRERYMPHTAGANDNASGVAAALHVAEHARELQQTELWVVATGCEESGLVGMARFLDAHPLDPASTTFINLDNCGVGRVAFTTSEGMLLPLRCDRELVALARESAAAEPRLDAAGRPFHTMNNDSMVPLMRGYRALSIMAFDERGLLPHWHWPTDTVDNLDEATLACAAELALRMVMREE